MRTIGAIDALREQRLNGSADVLEKAYEVLSAGIMPAFSFSANQLIIQISGVRFWVWEVGDDIINAYAEFFRLSLIDCARRNNTVNATVETVSATIRRP